MLLSRGIRDKRPVGSDIERMLRVPALRHSEADQVRALAVHAAGDGGAAIAVPRAPGAHDGRARHARNLGNLVEVTDVLRAVRVRAELELPRIRGAERVQVHY